MRKKPPPDPYDLTPRDSAAPEPRVDMRQLESRFDRTTDVVVEDRPCAGCGYNLKGLEFGGVCPECAKPITRFKPTIPPDSALEAPIGYIRLLQFGFILLSVASVGGIFLTMAVRLGVAGFDPAPFEFILASLWFAGVSVVCWPRPEPPAGRHRKGDWPVLRILAGSTQGAWPLWFILNGFATAASAAAAAGATGGTAAPSGPTGTIGWIAFVVRLIGVAGLPPTVWLFANLADWADDPDRARRLKLTAGWTLALAILIELGFTFTVPVGAPSLRLILMGLDLAPIGLAVAAGYTVWSLIQLSRTMGWAAINATTTRAREERLRERVAAERAAAEAELHRAEPFGGPLPTSTKR